MTVMVAKQTTDVPSDTWRASVVCQWVVMDNQKSRFKVHNRAGNSVVAESLVPLSIAQFCEILRFLMEWRHVGIELVWQGTITVFRFDTSTGPWWLKVFLPIVFVPEDHHSKYLYTYLPVQSWGDTFYLWHQIEKKKVLWIFREDKALSNRTLEGTQLSHRQSIKRKRVTPRVDRILCPCFAKREVIENRGIARRNQRVLPDHTLTAK